VATPRVANELCPQFGPSCQSTPPPTSELQTRAQDNTLAGNKQHAAAGGGDAADLRLGVEKHVHVLPLLGTTSSSPLGEAASWGRWALGLLGGLSALCSQQGLLLWKGGVARWVAGAWRLASGVV
jgi:hypothetical protein